MKKHLVLLLAFAATLLMTNCTKDRYYVRYEATATSAYHSGKMTLNVNTDTGIQTYTTSSKLYSETFGPVSKGFEASINASTNYGASLNTSIYVSKGEDPFVLKASGGPTAEYVIDF